MSKADSLIALCYRKFSCRQYPIYNVDDLLAFINRAASKKEVIRIQFIKKRKIFLDKTLLASEFNQFIELSNLNFKMLILMQKYMKQILTTPKEER